MVRISVSAILMAGPGLSGRIPAEQIVSHVIGLDDHAEAFRLLGIDLEGGWRTAPSAALKVVLTP